MKLHLGCGQGYLKSYINIDLPLSRRPCQQKSLADIHKDILKLNYPKKSVEEIRLHHVFEHFQRHIICALISAWYLWLKPNGILHIEVPDFYRNAKVVLNPFASKKMKFIALRHLGGSHEADWAVHGEGYTIKSLSYLLGEYGFKVFKTRRNKWKGTYNFEVIAMKKVLNLNLKSLENITRNYLTLFLIDKSETKLFNTWLDIYQKQMKRFFLKQKND